MSKLERARKNTAAANRAAFAAAKATSVQELATVKLYGLDDQPPAPEPKPKIMMRRGDDRIRPTKPRPANVRWSVGDRAVT